MKTLMILTLSLFLGLALAPPAAAQTADEDRAIAEEEARLEAEEAALDAAEARAATQADPSASNPAPAHPELKPVLDQFGGEAGLTRLMDDFMAGLLADERLGPFFANADQARIKRQLVEQFCVILGGDCTYTGRDMRSSHAGLDIARADFNRLVEVLQDAMDAQGIPFRAQNALLAKLAPMHREIITE